MAKTLKFLGIHGIGHQSLRGWEKAWQAEIEARFPTVPGLSLEFSFFTWDPYFDPRAVDALTLAKAGWKLGTSPFRQRALPGARGETFDWFVRPVAAWAAKTPFRDNAMKALLEAIEQEKPDVILAHSMGTLIAYDALSFLTDHQKGAYADVAKIARQAHFVTLGSQIGHPFVVGNLLRQHVEQLPVKEWVHLYNPKDSVFTSQIRLPGAPNFRQVTLDANVSGGVSNHSAIVYFSEEETYGSLWVPLASAYGGPGAPKSLPPTTLAKARAKSKPKTKAVLVGINDYPDPASRLQGCVNDCYLMSALLQERGFPAEDIRMCLNGRATAKAITNRLEWMLDDAAPGDSLVFFYSGHGAQLPTYGDGDTVDRMDETLVPYDFDWSDATCVKDDTIFDLYTQLAFDTRLLMIFDCCHSGGIHRHGGVRVRGLTPPDDIRHRAMRWDAVLQAWVPRDLPKINADFTKNRADAQRYFGQSGSVAKIGVAASLRDLPQAQYRKLSAGGRIAGPYQPVILQACQENEFSYEYTHGAESYGAFTFHLAQALRSAKKNPTFHQLELEVGKRLKAIGYQQDPELRGPTQWTKAPVPIWK